MTTKNFTLVEVSKLNLSSPSVPAGWFVPFAYHQHYSRGGRDYDPNWIPAVSYRLVSICDLFAGKPPLCKSYADARAALLAHTSRRSLGKHGSRGVKRLMPPDFPREFVWVDPSKDALQVSGWANELYVSEADWCSRSENSPYNKD